MTPETIARELNQIGIPCSVRWDVVHVDGHPVKIHCLDPRSARVENYPDRRTIDEIADDVLDACKK